MSGFVSATKEEMLKEIKNPSKVYKAKVISKNNGGFMIKLNGGITGFLPGSLAAANIVKDFDKMVGKDIYVMVDDYLWSSKMFVFSVKKYIQHVLPQKIKELDLEKKYTGTITDTSKFGIFIEFCEIFTGLLHTSKMSPELLQKFNKRELKSGQEIDFWILSNNDNKIILTDLDATLIRKQKEELIEELAQKNSITGTIIAIKEWGFLAKIGRTPLEDIIGVCYKKTKKEIGNQIDCKVNWNRDAGKIILDLV
jgi:ribosomal protein S1